MPGAPLPLHIFEPRYRQLTVDLVTGAVPDKQFGVVAVREGWAPDEDGRRPAHRRLHGRAARRPPAARRPLRHRHPRRRRFRLLDVDDRGQPVPDGGRSSTCPTPEAARRRRTSHDPRRRGPRRPPALLRHGLEERRLVRARRRHRAAELPHLLAADCLLPMSDRQRLLEQTRPAIRLRMVRALMIREAGLLGTAARRPRPAAHLRGRPPPQLTATCGPAPVPAGQPRTPMHESGAQTQDSRRPARESLRSSVRESCSVYASPRVYAGPRFVASPVPGRRGHDRGACGPAQVQP